MELKKTTVALWLTGALCLLTASCGGGAASITPDPNTNGSGTALDKGSGTSSFGIPAGMSGTVAAGQAVFTANCSGCHGNGSGLPAFTYAQFKARLAMPPMSSLTLTDQQIVDVVTWLNRNSAGTGGSGSGGNPPPGGTVTGDDNGAGSDDVAGTDDNGAGSDDVAGTDDNGTAGSGDAAGTDDSSTGSGGSAGADDSNAADDASGSEGSGSDG